MNIRLATILALSFQLLACGNPSERFSPELYSWEAARDSIAMPSSAWIIHCGSPERAIYRFGEERLAPGVACDGEWLFQCFMFCEAPCEGEDLPDYWLNPGYGTVPALEKAIEAAGDPPSKRYFTVSLIGDGDDEIFAHMDRVRSLFAALDCPHVELLGFSYSGDVSDRVKKYAEACHELLLEEMASVSFDYSVVEDIMDQPGVKSMDGKYTLKDVPARQKALVESLNSCGEGMLVMDCGINGLYQLSHSPYASDKALLKEIYNHIR